MANTVTASEALDWLKRMDQAQKTTAYDGRLVHLTGDKMRVVRVRHAFLDGVEYARVSHLGSVAAEVIRQGDKVICVYPGQPLSRHEQVQVFPFSSSLGVSQRLQQIHQYYSVDMINSDRVAGFNALQLQIRPKDQYRFAYRFWVDVDSGLLLKSHTLSQDGSVYEQYEYAHLDKNPEFGLEAFEPDPTLGSVFKHESSEHVGTNSANSGEVNWTLGWLPAGFVKARSHFHSVMPKMRNFVMQMYSDGLSTFTIFVEPYQKQQGVLPTVRQGATLTYSQLMPSSDYVATLMGEVPLVTAKAVLGALSMQKISIDSHP